MNHHFTGFLQLCDDTVQAVPALPNSKVPFNLAPLAGFLPFQLLLLPLDCRIGIGLAELGTVQMNSPFLAVLHALPSPEDRIRRNPLGIMPVGSFVGFHQFLKCGAFVVSIPSQVFYPQEAIHDAHFNLGSEFYIRRLFSPDDWSDPWLRNAHDPVFYLVGFCPVHVFLLGIQRADHLKHLLFPNRKGFLQTSRMLRFNGINGFKISLQESKLLADYFPDHLRCLLPSLGETVVLPQGFHTVVSGFQAISQSIFMEDINDFFSFLPGFIQQGCIRWKADILRGTGSVQNQGSLVFFLALASFVFFLSAISGAAGIIVCGW